jgi:hypothetical protein
VAIGNATRATVIDARPTHRIQEEFGVGKSSSRLLASEPKWFIYQGTGKPSTQDVDNFVSKFVAGWPTGHTIGMIPGSPRRKALKIIPFFNGFRQSPPCALQSPAKGAVSPCECA